MHFSSFRGLILPLAILATGALGLTHYYLVWWADQAARSIGYPVAVFGVPPAIWFVLGWSYGHVFMRGSLAKIAPWQVGAVAAGSALVFPLLYLWAASKPH